MVAGKVTEQQFHHEQRRETNNAVAIVENLLLLMQDSALLLERAKRGMEAWKPRAPPTRLRVSTGRSRHHPRPLPCQFYQPFESLNCNAEFAGVSQRWAPLGHR